MANIKELWNIKELLSLNSPQKKTYFTNIYECYLLVKFSQNSNFSSVSPVSRQSLDKSSFQIQFWLTKIRELP